MEASRLGFASLSSEINSRHSSISSIGSRHQFFFFSLSSTYHLPFLSDEVLNIEIKKIKVVKESQPHALGFQDNVDEVN